MHLKNKSNSYADALQFFESCPKTVLAAIAVSALTVGGDYLDEASERVLLEWWRLHQSHVVSQKPPGPPPPELEDAEDDQQLAVLRGYIDGERAKIAAKHEQRRAERSAADAAWRAGRFGR